jgi:hypothetical protein
LLGIALLLFFEDLAEAFEAPLEEVLARLLVALRLAADAFALLETLFLRVFCDTACARNRRAPVRVLREPSEAPKTGNNRIRSIECAYNSTFSVKINGLCPIPHHLRASGRQNTR